MGYAYYTDQSGRPAGYSVDATGEHESCATDIHRGVDYMCGGVGDEGCGRFFCYSHLWVTFGDEFDPLCERCSSAAELGSTA